MIYIPADVTAAKDAVLAVVKSLNNQGKPSAAKEFARATYKKRDLNKVLEIAAGYGTIVRQSLVDDKLKRQAYTAPRAEVKLLPPAAYKDFDAYKEDFSLNRELLEARAARQSELEEEFKRDIFKQLGIYGEEGEALYALASDLVSQMDPDRIMHIQETIWEVCQQIHAHRLRFCP